MKDGFAVVGLGGMGRHHVRVYKELDLLQAVCDTSHGRVSEFCKAFGIRGYTNLDEMLIREKLSGVSVVTPTPTHAEVAEKCLDSNLNVLLEKPMTPTVQQAQRLVNIANQKELVLAVGYIESYNPAFRFVQEISKEGIFGEITSVNIKRVGGSPRSADNVISDLMTHDIGLLIKLLGRAPDTIAALQRREKIVNSAQVLLGFDGVSTTCEANWVSPVKIRHMHVTGTNAYCEVDLITQKVRLLERSKGSTSTVRNRCGLPFNETVVSFSQEPLKEEIEEFVDCVSSKSGNLGNLMSGKDGVAILETTLDVIRKAGDACKC